MTKPPVTANRTARPVLDRVFLNSATIMSTTTPNQIEVARRTGFAGVEVRVERLLGSSRETRETAAAAESGEVWSLNGVQLQIIGNQLDRKRLERELGPRLAICQAVRAAYLLVVPPRAPEVNRRRAIAPIQEGLALALERARDAGVQIVFEYLGFGDCPINTLLLAAAVLDGVPGVEAVLDSCHWHASGAGSLAAFPVDRLAMVHLNDAPAKPPRAIEDSDRVLPGEGVIALSALAADLRARGYGGPFSLETFNPAYWLDDPQQVARKGRAAVARVLDGPSVAPLPGGSR